MSYRELRDFSEHMKTLGYPSALSIDSFRQPNFPLVASLLLFLLHRYDPTLIPPEDISTQPSRIAFVQSITSLLQSKCHIKLSMKQLYKADGYAVKELLKLSTTLYHAMSSSTASPITSPPPVFSSTPALPSFDSFKDAKTLANELIDIGERLSSLLSLEPTIRPSRDAALLFVDSLSGDDPRGQTVERAIRRQMGLMEDNVKELKVSHTQLLEDCEKIRGKVERKEGERDRMEKRWKALRRVKPQFIEEYEREERELKVVYAAYVERMRNVQWLEGEMKQIRREEEEEKKEGERRLQHMQHKLREEERKIMRGDHTQDDSDDEEEEEDEEDEDDEEGDDDEKGGYERKDDRGEEDEDEEDEDDEEDDDDEEKRPNGKRGGGPGRADDSVVRRHRHSGNTGRPKARAAASEEELTDSEMSGLGEDDYF